MILYDPKAYRKAMEPVERDRAEEEIKAFIEDVKTSASKHGIPDVTLCMMQNVLLKPRDLLNDEPEETFVQIAAHIGEPSKAVECVTFGHAQIRAETDARFLRIKAQAERYGKTLP